MPVFRVMLSGRKVVLKTEDGDSVCGFVRNEYVRASSEHEAIELAKKRVMERISTNEAISILADSPIELTVDEVESRVPIWKLIVNESFIFFSGEDGSEK